MDKEKKISYGKKNDLILKSAIAINRAANAMNKEAAQSYKEKGLTPMQFSVLEVLYHKGDLKICQIIEKILSTGGNMTVVIGNLEKENLITKYQDPKDNRATVISITKKGHDLIEEIFPKHLKQLDNFFSKLEEGEKEELCRILRKLTKINDV